VSGAGSTAVEEVAPVLVEDGEAVAGVGVEIVAVITPLPEVRGFIVAGCVGVRVILPRQSVFKVGLVVAFNAVPLPAVGDFVVVLVTKRSTRNTAASCVFAENRTGGVHLTSRS
jgi:hypothetical protein